MSISNQSITRILRANLITDDRDLQAGRSISLSPSGKITHLPTDPAQNAPSKDLSQNEEKEKEEEERECTIDGTDYLIAPSLCQPHIHLDKCFLFSDPLYSDLHPKEGTFAEALSLTSLAKERFTRPDLLRRGRWLIQESIEAGVTHMRCFVEVDHIVRHLCLDAATALQDEFKHSCEIQLCVFAQEPLFSGIHADENRSLILDALKQGREDVLGTTPYVESSSSLAEKNIRWAFDTARLYDRHLDFHLDYNLSASTPPLAPFVIFLAKSFHWARHHTVQTKTICLAHCTRLTLFSKAEWRELADTIHENDLPIYFIGLPTSDLYIQGAPPPEEGGGKRPRATLQIPQMVTDYGIKGALGVNNIGNAFTPQGSVDPLGLACMGVGVYQVGSRRGVKLLYDCVSVSAREAIGFGEGADGDLVLFRNERGGDRRVRGSLSEVVWDPPKGRRTIFHGRLVGG